MAKVRATKEYTTRKWEKFEGKLEDKVAHTENSVKGEQIDPSARPSFRYFMAGEIPPNKKEECKEPLLLAALQQGDWAANIFEDEEVEQIALLCFKEGKITRQQFITLLERQQQQLDFPDRAIKTYRLLDDNGHYTEYANQKFLPLLGKALSERVETIFDEDRKEYLRFLIATLPSSEQIVYRLQVEFKDFFRRKPPSAASEEGAIRGNLLDAMLRVNEALLEREGKGRKEENEFFLTSMSAGVEDAVGIACYGVKRYVVPIHRIKPINTREIEEGVRNDFRPTSIVRRNDPPIENIHADPKPQRTAATKHDRYHAGVMSRIPPQYRQAFLYIVDFVRERLISMSEREKIGKVNTVSTLMTHEIWLFIDSEFSAKESTMNFFKKQASHATKTAGFCRLLGDSVISDDEDIFHNHSDFINRDSDITVFSMLVMVDMINNPENWSKKFNIEPAHLTDKIKEHYDFIRQLAVYDENFLQDVPELQALKLRLLQEIGSFKDKGQELSNFFKEIETYCAEQGGVDEVCQFARATRKRAMEAPFNRLILNQVGLEILPQHQAEFDNIKRRATSERSAWCVLI